MKPAFDVISNRALSRERIDEVRPDELKFALALGEAAFTGRMPMHDAVKRHASWILEWGEGFDPEAGFPNTPEDRVVLALLDHCQLDREKFFALMTRMDNLFFLLDSARMTKWVQVAEGDRLRIHDAVIAAVSTLPLSLESRFDEGDLFRRVEELARNEFAGQV